MQLTSTKTNHKFPRKTHLNARAKSHQPPTHNPPTHQMNHVHTHTHTQRASLDQIDCDVFTLALLIVSAPHTDVITHAHTLCFSDNSKHKSTIRGYVCVCVCGVQTAHPAHISPLWVGSSTSHSTHTNTHYSRWLGESTRLWRGCRGGGMGACLIVVKRACVCARLLWRGSARA